MEMTSELGTSSKICNKNVSVVEVDHRV